MRELKLFEVSQVSAYRYTGITTFENLAEVTGEYPYEEEVLEKAEIQKENMMSQGITAGGFSVPAFSVTLRISPDAAIAKEEDGLLFRFEDYDIRDGRSKCAAVSLLEPEWLEDNCVKLDVFVVSEEKMGAL